MINVLSNGKERREKFTNECSKDPSRFVKPIQRNKVSNFASDNSKKKSKIKGLGNATESVRDIFARVVILASSQFPDLDLNHLLSFPITEVPLSLSHTDGTPIKTDKSALMKVLEKRQSNITTTENMPPIDSSIIDGGLLLHSALPFSRGTFGNMAHYIFLKVISLQGQEIHVIFDTYDTSSLKQCERQARGSNDTTFIINGPEQTPKQKTTELLKSSQFKDQFADFVMKEWSSENYSALLGDKILIVSHGSVCQKYVSDTTNRQITVTRPPLLQGNHEEADTAIVFHLSHTSGNVLVRSSDTDVFVILLMFAGNLSDNTLTIILDSGTGNNRHLINVSQLAITLNTTTPHLTSALPGLHAFTGCDFTAAFFRKGKVKALQLLENDTSERYVEAFKLLSTSDPQDVKTLSKFVCELYGQKSIEDVNLARTAVFKRMSGKVSSENPLKNAKRLDCALLPPCENTLQKKIQRANYVSIIWGRSALPNPVNGLNPVDYGWRFEEGHFVHNWFDGSAVPNSLVKDDNDVAEELIDNEDVAIDDAFTDNQDEEWSDREESNDESENED